LVQVESTKALVPLTSVLVLTGVQSCKLVAASTTTGLLVAQEMVN
jgi:hypothetical protein